MFLKKNETILNDFEKKILNTCFANFANNLERASEFPLNFCHGDFKSANVYYANNMSPYILDWQYIQLNKGISDIVFLLIESIDYDERLVMTILNYYYYLITQTGIHYEYENMMNDFKLNLQIFPFVVCVWFNSEDSDKLLDKVFPVKFMRNMLKYYNRFLTA
jgi:thiamine kinase-like enzyme